MYQVYRAASVRGLIKKAELSLGPFILKFMDPVYYSLIHQLISPVIFKSKKSVMKFVALVSGGKDSIYSIIQCIENGHELVACVHIGAPDDSLSIDDDNDEESYMYQSAASEAVKILVEECLCVPLILYTRKGKSINISLVYDDVTSNQSNDRSQQNDTNDQNEIHDHYPATNHDEVEDLYHALIQVKQRFPDVSAVCSGAILSTYQRVRIEQIVCNRLNWTSLCYLWRKSNQKQLLHEMIHSASIDAIIVRTASPPGLIPNRHLQKSIQDLQYHFENLYEKFQFHICGEGGEYETLVLDCPLFQRKLVIDQAVKKCNDNDDTGTLYISRCHAEEKSNYIGTVSSSTNIATPVTSTVPMETLPMQLDATNNRAQPKIRCGTLPGVCQVSGGFLAISSILSQHQPAATEHGYNQRIKDQAMQIFEILQFTLLRYDCYPTDVVKVYLYLSEISLFASINEYYKQFFGIVLPPSRCCIAVGKNVLPGNRQMMLDCLVQRGSGQYLRQKTATPSMVQSSLTNGSSSISAMKAYTNAANLNTATTLRKVLHVQSISYWAPVCVGPYSQVNTIRDCLHLIAGQIGLIPQSMKLQPTWVKQLEQAWKNVTSILDALDHATLATNMISAIIFVSDSVYNDDNTFSQLHAVSGKLIETNCSIQPGFIDGIPYNDDDSAFRNVKFDGYEDEETMLAMSPLNTFIDDGSSDSYSNEILCPILVVSIPEMPVGALVEIDITASTTKLSKCLQSKTAQFKRCHYLTSSDVYQSKFVWNTGYDFSTTKDSSEMNRNMFLNDNQVSINCWFRCIGTGVASCGTVTASILHTSSSVENNSFDFMIDSFSVFSSMLEALRLDHSVFNCANTVQVKLYYNGFIPGQDTDHYMADDDMEIRSCFHAACQKHFTICPAVTVIPVRGIHIMKFGQSNDLCDINKNMIYALQAVSFDPAQAETSLWIHQER